MTSDIIVSLTSWKPRLQYAHIAINSILSGNLKPHKIVFTLFYEDIPFITKELQKMIDNNDIELLICDTDLGAAKKWFYVLQKYPNNPIVLIDDDIIYHNDLLEKLYNYSIKYPNTVIANWCRPIILNSSNEIQDFNITRKQYLIYNFDIEPSHNIHFMSGAGTLIPPEAIYPTDNLIDDILKYKQIEEVYLKFLLLQNNIKIKNIPLQSFDDAFTLMDGDVQKYALWNLNRDSINAIDNNVGYENLLLPEFKKLYENYIFNNPIITIVIPCYNPIKEKFDRCINSIINQSIGFNNIKIIIVDDCSTDKLVLKYIENAYISKYNNMQLVKLLSNNGPGNARNVGLSLCESEYITFMDYDDYYINDNILAKIYQHFIYNPTIDFITGARQNISNGEIIYFDNIKPNQILLINDNKCDILKSNLVSPQSKIYKTSFLINNKIKFENLRSAQDRLFYITAVLKSSNILELNEPVFYYDNSNNQNKITNTFNYDTLTGIIDCDLKLIDLFEQHNQENSYIAVSDIMNVINRYNKTIKFLTIDEKEKIDEKIEKLFNHTLKNISFYKKYESIIYENYKKICHKMPMSFFDNNQIIDIVIPYVKVNSAMIKKFKQVNHTMLSINLYDDFGLLKYVLRSIEKNMSWINKIHLVVADKTQIPTWISDKVNIVYHNDIIPNEFLPTFNSCCIEMFIHKIPNLSEKFIYFNDDIIVAKSCHPSDFFIRNLPNLHFISIDNKKAQSVFDNNNYNNSKLIFNNDKYFEFEHSCHPRLKSLDETAFNFYKNEILNSISPLRNVKNYNQYLFLNYYIKQQKYNNCVRKSIFFIVDELKHIELFFACSSCKIACINDAINIINRTIVKKTIINILNKVFKTKSKYEK